MLQPSGYYHAREKFSGVSQKCLPDVCRLKIRQSLSLMIAHALKYVDTPLESKIRRRGTRIRRQGSKIRGRGTQYEARNLRYEPRELKYEGRDQRYERGELKYAGRDLR